MELDVWLRQLSAERDGAVGWWRIRWQIDNRGSDELRIDSALVPHGQFKAEEQRFAPPLDLKTSSSTEFFSHVRCHEPAGLVTENAFVILHCRWRGEAWRVFIRIRVTVSPGGLPESAVELVTTQRVGFSGIPN